MVHGRLRSALARGGALLCVLALGALLSGCDKCGDWWGRSYSQACKDTTPSPR
jgi:hypothetical protein